MTHSPTVKLPYSILSFLGLNSFLKSQYANLNDDSVREKYWESFNRIILEGCVHFTKGFSETQSLKPRGKNPKSGPLHVPPSVLGSFCVP